MLTNREDADEMVQFGDGFTASMRLGDLDVVKLVATIEENLKDCGKLLGANAAQNAFLTHPSGAFHLEQTICMKEGIMIVGKFVVSNLFVLI